MMNIMHFYEAGKARSGRVLIPFFDTVTINNWRFSTRHGNAKVKWGDGTENDYVLEKNIDYTSGGTGTSMLHTYATPYTGDVEVIFKQGLSDVYSVNVVYWGSAAQTNKINIQDFGTYIKKFSNLYSFLIDTYAYQITANMPIIKGDLADVPASVERIKIGSFEVLNNSTDVWFNFSSLPSGSKLKYLDLSGEIGTGTRRKILGNLGNLPVGCSFVRISRADNSSITYTAGKVWASSFDTLSITFPLSRTEIDNLLIDMDNSIATKIGDGVITLGGYRSSVSDAAVASLVTKGFTVNVNRGYQILNLPFQNSFADSGEMGMTMVAGGTSNQPTFALSGRKAGEYCAVFNGSQSIKTTTNLPINSDKVTLVFAMKTDSSTAGIIGELSADISSNNAFNAYLNVGNVKNLNVTSRQSGFNQSRINNNSLHGNIWNRIVIVIDRSLNASNEILIYVNGSLATFTKPASTDNVGNFVNNILFIGQRAGNTLGFVGSLMHYKVHNYPFAPAEVTADYNAFL